MARELVTKENSLVAASYSLDLIEQRLILLSIALSRRTGLGLSAQNLYSSRRKSFLLPMAQMSRMHIGNLNRPRKHSLTGKLRTKM